MAEYPQKGDNLQQPGYFPTPQIWYTEKPEEPQQNEAPPPYHQTAAHYSPEQGVEVTTAPTSEVIMRSSYRTEANDYLCFSIFTMLLCCLPCGIIALIKSLDVRARNAGEDYAGAAKMSRSARNWNITALVIGIITYLIFIIVFVCFVTIGPGAGKSLGAGKGGKEIDIGGNDNDEYSWG